MVPRSASPAHCILPFLKASLQAFPVQNSKPSPSTAIFGKKLRNGTRDLLLESLDGELLASGVAVIIGPKMKKMMPQAMIIF